MKVRIYLRAVNPPKSAPEANPTQNPMVKPYFILSKHDGCPYIDGWPGGA